MVSYLQEQSLTEPERGDKVRAVKLPSRRVTTSRSLSARPFGLNQDHGFTLIELVITITVLTILTLGVVPLLKISVKRQREQQLRLVLREMRTAIDDFHRDTIDMQCTGPPTSWVNLRLQTLAPTLTLAAKLKFLIAQFSASITPISIRRTC